MAKLKSKDKVEATVISVVWSEGVVFVGLEGKFDEHSDKEIKTNCHLFYTNEKESDKIDKIVSRDSKVIVYRKRIKDTKAWTFDYIVNPEVGDFLSLMSGYRAIK